ncbi:MAG TPA: M1 family aminopeptidase [Candidatus Acidoferrales bacterium]|nr:M1 family aminopeptidase [Candidatus Acidoferrales bacterium]
MSKFPLLLLLASLAGLVSPARAQSPGAPQGPARGVAPVQSAPVAAFRATNYEIHASLDTFGQVMNAQAKVDFAANDSARVVEVELNQNLRINSIRDLAGKPVNFDRDDMSAQKLRVTLNDTAPAGSKVTLVFDYGGPLSSRVVNPDQGARMAYIAKDGGYLLLPARWFPLTDFPSNRYTGIFQIEVPGNMTVVGTGTLAGAPTSVTPKPIAPLPANSKAGPAALGNSRAKPSAPVVPMNAPPPPPMENERMLYTYRVDKPEAAGTFVISPLQLNPEHAQGMTFSIYTPPAAANTAQAYANSLAQVVDYFNDAFGALPDPTLTVAQLPDGTVDGFAAPGLLLVSARQWSAKPNERILADLAAHQWWGSQVMAATPSDAWLTDGLSRYAEGLYVEQTSGKDALNKAIEDFAVGALMFDDSAPIADARRLEPGTEEYQSVVVNKGAIVFHMLRSIIGDANFSALLKDFYTRYAGKSARVQDFEQLSEMHMAKAAPAEFKMGNTAPASNEPTSLRPFFTQWVHSTGVPEFNIEYVVYRTKKGFRIVGKAKQNLDVFHMDVEIEVQTEGNPEFKTITISGKESPFTVETFGRPKPNGILLDPHDYILKSNQRLRVRGIIARGESLASEGRYYDAVVQYQKALEEERQNALAEFRMGEAFFYQRNYAAAAQSFRDALDGATDLTTKWTEVWSHIYLGRIYDIQGDRTRAVNEYNKAKQTADDTGGAQAEAEKSMKKAYSEAGS